MTLLICIILIAGLDLSWHWLWLVAPTWLLHTSTHLQIAWISSQLGQVRQQIKKPRRPD